jgi:hypothetical protein
MRLRTDVPELLLDLLISSESLASTFNASRLATDMVADAFQMTLARPASAYEVSYWSGAMRSNLPSTLEGLLRGSEFSSVFGTSCLPERPPRRCLPAAAERPPDAPTLRPGEYCALIFERADDSCAVYALGCNDRLNWRGNEYNYSSVVFTCGLALVFAVVSYASRCAGVQLPARSPPETPPCGAATCSPATRCRAWLPSSRRVLAQRRACGRL